MPPSHGNIFSTAGVFAFQGERSPELEKRTVPTGGHCFNSWSSACDAPGCVGDIQGSSPDCLPATRYCSAGIKFVN